MSPSPGVPHFSAPDLKAVRFRKSRHGTLNRAYIRRLRADFPNRKALALLSDARIKQVIRTFHRLLCEQIVSTRQGVTLPDRLGELFVASCPPKKDGVLDMAASIALGRAVYHQNGHTDGRLCKIVYQNTAQRQCFVHHTLWQFTPVRSLKKAASAEFATHFTRYRALDNEGELRRRTYTQIRQRRQAFVLAKWLQTYEEFDL